MRIGIDTGGTFTDFVLADGERVEIAKLPSTPDDPGRAILAGLRRFDAPDAELVHGTTVATNALLERRVARVTFVTNAGLEDVLEIGRQARPELYALDIDKAVPLVPRELRLGVAERTGADGSVVARLDERGLQRIVAQVKRTRPEAIAIGLVFSFLHPAAERRLARALRPLGVPICLSSAIAPEIREFERFSTTVANAALIPGVSLYLTRLARALTGRRLFVFQSNGGMARAEAAAAAPVRLVLSGPAGGAVAAAAVAARAGLGPSIALDMGGTSTDVSMIAGDPLRRGEVSLAGMPLLVPSLDIESVGAGGGSIAWLDDSGRLRVGPRSAGADPGPACYGRSDEPTVTDAHLVLGRLPTTLAGGVVTLDTDAANRALDRLGKRLGMHRRAAAEGVLRVADATMARAARSVVLGRGGDPRGMALIAFGGAGPLHAARLIAVLPCRLALIPWLPGNLSAYGIACADAERDLVRSVLVRDPDRHRTAIDRVARELTALGRADLRRDRLGDDGALRVIATLDCRYLGQSYTLPIDHGREMKPRFDVIHRQSFGHAFAERPIEVVNVRVRLLVAGRGAASPGHTATPRPRQPPAGALLRTQPGWFGGRAASVRCFAREALPIGTRIVGPAILEEQTATTVIEPGTVASIDGNRYVRITPT